MNKIQQLQELLPKEIDCALITSDINRRYFSGFKSSAGVVAVFHEATYLLIDSRYFEKASLTVKNCEVLLLENLDSQLPALLLERGVKTVAVESMTMTVQGLEDYRKILPDASFVFDDTLSKLIEKLRAVKEDWEIQCMVKAQRIAEAAFENVLTFIKEGVTEKEVGFALDSYMLTHGAEAVSFETIALFGENTSMPHGVPSDRKLRRGEFVLMDFGAAFDGYHSDMTRTVCFGEPSEEMKRVYEIVLEAQEASIAVARAGICGKDMDKAARDVIVSAGFGKNFGHGLGHGVGIEIHEAPTASPKGESVFSAGMVVTAEPGIYLAGKFGVRIEDFVVILEDGCENLTKAPKNLICL